jgi:Leucine-rich repeat (LRR) protein
LPNLRYLKLDHNRIEEIPNFCDVNNESYIPKLDELVLNKNYVARIHIQTFNCFPKLQTYFLEGKGEKDGDKMRK